MTTTGAPLTDGTVALAQLEHANEHQAGEIAGLKRRCARLSALAFVLVALVALLVVVIIDQYLSRFFHCLLLVWAGVALTVAVQLFGHVGARIARRGVVQMEDLL